ncbi:MAG: hypothetical protein ACTSV3_04470 [Candidatus Thorarchaeota archaeon]|nr:MAG: hypothetical protein DRP09_02615 [Candidatus Thorarchaeota archaeon]RLI60025.1 MAG: hypothetical protein DRO87_01045 [Candidatus Thorarchaeota archaeon]
MAFNPYQERYDDERWSSPNQVEKRSQSINMAPLKGAIEADPVRSRVLRVLVEDGSWVTTADLLRAARQERPIVGAVTIGMMLNGLNDLVSSRLILSRTSMNSGIDWAEWRIDPDWLEPTRSLLRMLSRPKFQPSSAEGFLKKTDRLLEDMT